MTKTFVIADLHGRNDLLVMAITKLEELHPDGGKVIFTGDYVDRGLEGRQVIETLMAGPKDTTKWEWIFLMGNHEDLMLNAVAFNKDVNLWIMNGGGTTLISYGAKEGAVIADPSKHVPQEHGRWLANLPLYHVDKHRIYVHAGIAPDCKDLENHSRSELIWMRYYDYDGKNQFNKHVVHGHNPFEDGPRIWAHRTDLDTEAYWTGRLVIGVFDDDTEGSFVDTIEIQGKTLKETIVEYRNLSKV